MRIGELGKASPCKENTGVPSPPSRSISKAMAMPSTNPAADRPRQRRVLLPSLGGRRPLGALPTTPSTVTTTSSAAQRRWRRDSDSLDEMATQLTHHSSVSSSTRPTTSSSPPLQGAGGRPAGRIRVGGATDPASAAADVGEHTHGSLFSAVVPRAGGSRGRVLRYGETVESLFCLEAAVTDDGGSNDGRHRALCQAICSGERSADAEAWREALELSLDGNRSANRFASGGEGGSDVGKRLIHLHRRATSRFKLFPEKDTPNHTAVLKIWLFYALVLLKFGKSGESELSNINDSRHTLKHVQRLYFGKNGREFYGALMERRGAGEEGQMKEDVDGALYSLQRLMEKEVSIAEIVKAQMIRLEENGLLTSRGGAVDDRDHDRVGNCATAGTATSAPVQLVSLPTLGPRKENQLDSEEKHFVNDDAKSPSPKDDGEFDGIPAITSFHNANQPFVVNSTEYSSLKSRPVLKDGSISANSQTISSCQCTKRPLKATSAGYLSLKSKQSSTNSRDNGKSIKPSFRVNLESRKKLKISDRNPLHLYGTRKFVREGSGGATGKGGLRAILSRKMVDDDNSSDDNGHESSCYGEAKRSTDSSLSVITDKPSDDLCASAVTAKRSANSCASEAGDPSQKTSPKENDEGGALFEDISPIDTEPTFDKDVDLDYLLNWDPTKRDNHAPKMTKKVKIAGVSEVHEAKEGAVRTAVPSVPKITRNDLGYMMDWDPFANDRSGQKEEKDLGLGGEPGVVLQRSAISQHNGQGNGMFEESTILGDRDNNAVASQSRVSHSSNQESDEKSDFSRKSRSFTGASSDSRSENPSRTEEFLSQEGMICASQLNCSFLPLIENKNIIQVEGKPYAKLSVIGKGGSCKVFRALSRECDVVALKKVKLDGLNKAAIDGYANEIALLQRLKGNPAIIQLYSAEVDLERQSILLVMELGEVDLDYVLRQQELLSSKLQGRGAGRMSLNMDFIRLTWRQMLTAVHSIHEERIIHSDLKPANFLFVRGALKLIDFGIAKAIEKEDTTNVYRETLSGTLSYMSPEAIMDTSTDAKGVRVNKCGRPSDIWSLGCILYQMVYGKTPFANCHGIPQKVLAITNVNHEIHFTDGVDEPALDAMKLCLRRNPKQRPPIIGKNGLLNEHCFLHGGREKSNRSRERAVRN